MVTQDKTIEERVKEAVVRVFHRNVTEINRDTRFVEDLLAKSINITELIAFLEYGFNIDIPRQRARLAKTVGDAVNLVESLLKN